MSPEVLLAHTEPWVCWSKRQQGRHVVKIHFLVVELTVFVLEMLNVGVADIVHWHVQVVETVERVELEVLVWLAWARVVPVGGERGWQHNWDLVLVDEVDELRVVYLVAWTNFVVAETVFVLLMWLGGPCLDDSGHIHKM